MPLTLDVLETAVAAARSAAAMPPLSSHPKLSEAASWYANQSRADAAALERFADTVHAVLGAHAVAAVEVMARRSPRDLASLAGVRFEHFAEFGVGFCGRAAKPVDVVIVYAKRGAWPYDRRARRRLRAGLDAFLGEFCARHGKDAAWTRRWSDGAEDAYTPLLAAASRASGLDPDEFDARIWQDPLLQQTLRKSLRDLSSGTDLASSGERESVVGSGASLPLDL
ncbi:MAG TPA: hypothetical protein VGI39_36770 [Polyangiaceae bacterium]|jgi:hypothetical protein